MNKCITPSEINEVYQKIREDILKTPLEYSPKLSLISGARVFLKMEHLQFTGSFKLRGVLSKIKSLKESDFQKPFIAASTGNHAAAFAYASKRFGFDGILFMPQNASKVKRNVLDGFDIEIALRGKNSMETEATATNYARDNYCVLIHPYNDREIIKGQGTIGVEIQEQLPEIDTVLAPVGGGGLISGLCSYFSDTDVKVIGCQPNNASEMYDSVKQGNIVSPSSLSTISDATAGGIEDDSLTFEICENQLDGFELIEEEKIKEAVSFVLKHHHTIIEPGAALSVSALLNSKKYKGKNVVLVLTGKKIEYKLLTEIIHSYGSSY